MKTIPLICSEDGFYTMITLLILDTTFSIYYFRPEDILHPFPKVFNLGRFISQNKTARIQTEKTPNNIHKQFYGNLERH